MMLEIIPPNGKSLRRVIAHKQKRLPLHQTARKMSEANGFCEVFHTEFNITSYESYVPHCAGAVASYSSRKLGRTLALASSTAFSSSTSCSLKSQGERAKNQPEIIVTDACFANRVRYIQNSYINMYEHLKIYTYVICMYIVLIPSISQKMNLQLFGQFLVKMDDSARILVLRLPHDPSIQMLKLLHQTWFFSSILDVTIFFVSKKKIKILCLNIVLQLLFNRGSSFATGKFFTVELHEYQPRGGRTGPDFARPRTSTTWRCNPPHIAPVSDSPDGTDPTNQNVFWRCGCV